MSLAVRLQSVPLPFRPKGRVRSCLTDPTRRFLGLLSDEGLHVLSYQDGLAAPELFRLPEAPQPARQETVQMAFMGKLISMPIPRRVDPPSIALHPQGNQVAFVTDQQVTRLGPAGQAPHVAHTFADPPAGHVKAALFSCTGAVLWVSRELQRDPGRQGQPDPWHELLAFSTADWKLLGRVAARGEMQGGHNLAAHPTEDIVGLEVSCGQDGSWITFATVQDGQISVFPEHVEGDSDPFSFAGFAPDGQRLMITGESTIQEFQWPGCQRTAQVEASAGEEDAFFGWNGVYAGPFFFALAEGEENDVLSAYAWPGLRAVEDIEVKPARKQLNGALYGLGDDLLITGGASGIRAWRVIEK